MSTEMDDSELRKRSAVTLYQQVTAGKGFHLCPEEQFKVETEAGKAVFILSSVEQDERITNHVVWANQPWHKLCGLTTGLCCQGSGKHGENIKSLVGGKTQGLTAKMLKDMQTSLKEESDTASTASTSSGLVPIFSDSEEMRDELMNVVSEKHKQFDIMKDGKDFSVKVKCVRVMKSTENGTHVSACIATEV